MTGRLIGIARKEKPYAVPETLREVRISVEAGLDGDCRGRVHDRQVTVLAREDWEAACKKLGRELPWTVRRANLYVDGLDLPQRPGALIKIGGLVLEVRGKTDPCSRMEQQAEGLRAALTPDWRGGVHCVVRAAGEIKLGDGVQAD